MNLYIFNLLSISSLTGIEVHLHLLTIYFLRLGAVSGSSEWLLKQLSEDCLGISLLKAQRYSSTALLFCMTTQHRPRDGSFQTSASLFLSHCMWQRASKSQDLPLKTHITVVSRHSEASLETKLHQTSFYYTSCFLSLLEPYLFCFPCTPCKLPSAQNYKKRLEMCVLQGWVTYPFLF